MFGLEEEDDNDSKNQGNPGYNSNRESVEPKAAKPVTSKKGLARMRTQFKHWILNLDVYGSFEPLNP